MAETAIGGFARICAEAGKRISKPSLSAAQPPLRGTVADEGVRVAFLKALCAVGDAADVTVLAGKMAARGGPDGPRRPV